MVLSVQQGLLALSLLLCCQFDVVVAVSEELVKAYATVIGVALLTCCLCATLAWTIYRAATQGRRKSRAAKERRAQQRAARDGYSEA